MLAHATPSKPAPFLGVRGMGLRLCIGPNAFGNALGNSIVEGMQPEPALGKTFAEDVAARKASNYWNPEPAGSVGASSAVSDGATGSYWDTHPMMYASNEVADPLSPRVLIDAGAAASNGWAPTGWSDNSPLRAVGETADGGLAWNTGAVSYPVELPNIEMRPLPDSGSGSIQADPGYLAALQNIYNSDLPAGQKLGMAWDNTKFYFQGSQAAQGTVQAVGGAFEVAGAVGVSSTGIGAAVGVPLAFHGGDNIGTGLSRIFRDESQSTVTYAGVEGLTGSPFIARSVDNAIPFLGGAAGAAQAVNALTAESFAILGRKELARGFYEEQGWAAKRIESHLNGIDFTKDVGLVTLSPGKAVGQWQVPGNGVGNYFAPLGTEASQLGINPAGRELITYTPSQPVQVLRSTAAEVVDTWSVPGVSYRAQGGGTQYFTRQPDLFAPIKSR